MTDYAITHANRGVCYIVRVTDSAWPPAIAEAQTSLCERFPIFAQSVRSDARVAERMRIPVRLSVKRSARGTRYIDGLTIVNFAEPTQPCQHCGQQMQWQPSGDSYQCASCHAIMMEPARL